MSKVKKICIRITPRRILGSVLVAASLVNLVIVGMVFEASASMAITTIAATQTVHPGTMTIFVPTATDGEIASATFESTVTPTQTFTITSTSTFTPTSTDTTSPTFTNSPSPAAPSCVPRYAWPIYIVQSGDTLYSLAIATGSSVDELIWANCLPDSIIFIGQLLYVPRMPIVTLTPSNTPPTPSNSQAEFRPNVMSCDYPTAVSFAVSVYDPEGIKSVEVRVYARVEQETELAARITLEPNGNTYYGSGDLSEPFTVYNIAYYSFYAVDSVNDDTISPAYEDRSSDCIGILLAPQEGLLDTQ